MTEIVPKLFSGILDMNPSLTVFDVLDTCSAHVEVFFDGSRGFACYQTPLDHKYISTVKFRWNTAFSPRVAHIIRAGAEEKMVRITARRVVAAMADVEIAGVNAIVQIIGDAVSLCENTVWPLKAMLAVSPLGSTCAAPLPANIFRQMRRHKCPKNFNLPFTIERRRLRVTVSPKSVQMALAETTTFMLFVASGYGTGLVCSTPAHGDNYIKV